MTVSKNDSGPDSGCGKEKKNTVSTAVMIGCRFVAAVFFAGALFTFLVSLTHPFGIWTLVYFSYVALDAVLTYGFWKMRKWAVVLMGITVVFLIVNSSIRVMVGTQRVGLALLVSLLYVIAVLVFSYLSRDFLVGGYKHVKAIRLFVVTLIAAQILSVFK